MKSGSIKIPVQSLWIGRKLGRLEQLCIRSFRARGHVFHLYVYGVPDGIPEGTMIKDASEILPESDILYYTDQPENPSAFSNLFRYKLLYIKGGYWVDMDMIALRSLEFEEDYVFSSEAVTLKGFMVTTPNTGIIKAPRGSVVMKRCYDKAVELSRKSVTWGDLGPKLMRGAIKHFGLSDNVKKPRVFCPFYLDELDDIFNRKYDAELNKKLADSYTIHLWNKTIKEKGIDKEKIIPETLYSYLNLLH